MPSIPQMIRTGRATDGHTSASLLRMGVEGRGHEIPGSDDALAAADRIDKLEDALSNLCIAIGMGWDLDGVLEVAVDALPNLAPPADVPAQEVVAETGAADLEPKVFEARLQDALESGNFPTALIAVLDLGGPAPVVAGRVHDAGGFEVAVQFHACGTYDVLAPNANRVQFNTKTTNQIAALCLQAEEVWDELSRLHTTGGWKDWSHMLTPVRAHTHVPSPRTSTSSSPISRTSLRP